MSLIDYLPFGSNDETRVGGAEEVARAIKESRTEEKKVAFLGEPRLYEVGEYNTEHKVQIPVSADYPIADLEFDLPQDEDSELEDFLSRLGFKIEELGELQGTVVEVEYDERVGTYHLA